MDVFEGRCNKEGRLFMEDGWMYRQQWQKLRVAMHWAWELCTKLWRRLETD